MTKQETLALIDKLADKTLSFGCLIDWGDWGRGIKGRNTNIRPYSWFDHSDDADCLPPEKMKNGLYEKILGHPILLGNIFDRLDNSLDLLQRAGMGNRTMNSVREGIILFWGRCGISLSLQEIIERSGFISVFGEGETTPHEILTDPFARSLFETLGEIFNPPSRTGKGAGK